MIEWQNGWRAFDAPEREEELLNELRLETGDSNQHHPLHGKTCRVIGWKAPPAKDFILSLPGEPSYAYVHLTWSKETDPQWPRSRPIRSIDSLNLFLREWGNGSTHLGRSRLTSPIFPLAILLLPLVLFGANFSCHKVTPGEHLSWQELLLPPIGAPFALMIATAVFPVKSFRERVALTAIIVLSFLVLTGAAINIRSHW